MKQIPVVRAVHFSNYLQFLWEIGAPVERRLHQMRLPIQHIDQPDSYLPLPNVLAFLRLMGRSEGIDDLGLRALPHVKASYLSADFLQNTSQAPTLLAALQSFCRLSNHETSYINFWIGIEEFGIKIYNSFNADCDPWPLRYSEWLQNFTLVAIVRLFAGSQWLPTEMAFQSNVPLAKSAWEAFPNVRFLPGQKNSWIDVPRSLLSLPPTARLSPPIPQAGRVELPLNFPDTLKLLVKPYLADGYPDIHLTAEMAGTSVRTLQRQLAKDGLSYSQLIQQVRLETSMGLLKDRNIKIMDVAINVGYEDPSNFSRAFRSFTGLSPQEFRHQQAS